LEHELGPDGNLHLTVVAPRVEALPRPTLVWRGIIRYILDHPQLAPRIRTITDGVRRLDHDTGVMTMHPLPLPRSVRRHLGIILRASVGEADATWSGDERVRPYAGPQPQADDHIRVEHDEAADDEVVRATPGQADTSPLPSPPGPRADTGPGEGPTSPLARF